ncbi:MAG TPA: aldo/keto reductase [Sorangium sp.]|nr:aldo/keto reductase [Sorangium sp.]
MRTRRFGRNDFQVSELSLGTWGLSGDGYGPVQDSEVDRVIDRALELGVTLFETADVYGAGAMEKKLGARLDAKNTHIVTKIGTFVEDGVGHKRFDAKSLAVAFDNSQQRIGRDKLDVVLLHNPTVTALQAGEASAFLRERVEAEQLRCWGVSAGSEEVANAAIDLGADVVELAYNAFHQHTLHALSDRLAMTDTAVLARSVLAHGLLAGHWIPNKTFFEHDHRAHRWTKDGLEYRRQQLRALRAFVRNDVVTLRSVALRFVLSNELVTTAVLGPRTLTQLNQLCRESGGEPPYLDEETMRELPKRLQAIGVAL